MKIQSLDDIEREVESLVDEMDQKDFPPQEQAQARQESKEDKAEKRIQPVATPQQVRDFELLMLAKAKENIAARNLIPEIYRDKFTFHFMIEGGGHIRSAQSANKVAFTFEFEWPDLVSNFLSQVFWDECVYPNLIHVPGLYRRFEKEFRSGFRTYRKSTEAGKRFVEAAREDVNRLLISRRVEVIREIHYTAVDIITGHEWTWIEETKDSGEVIGRQKHLELSRDIHALDAARFADAIDDEDDLIIMQHQEIRQTDSE